MITVLLQPNPTSGDFSENAQVIAALAQDALTRVTLPSTSEAPFKVLVIPPFHALVGTPWLALSEIQGFYERCRAALDDLGGILRMLPAFAKNEAAMLVTLPSADHHAERFFLLHGGTAREYRPQEDGLLELPGLSLYLPEQDFECDCDGESSSAPPPSDAVLFGAPAPFYWTSQEKDEAAATEFAAATGRPVLLVNQVGATDGTVYAGQSCVFAANGDLAARGRAFEEDSLVLDIRPGRGVRTEVEMLAGTGINPLPAFEGALFRAASLAVRDYVRKCGLAGAVVGLSGGMDSALVAAIAVDALGADRVHAVLMPSPWSSGHSVTDARELAEKLEISWHKAPIGSMMEAFDGVLNPLLESFPSREGDLGAENLQARIRGVLLMAYANRLSSAVLGTGNKSEAAVGYCTLYGDTVGAIEPISDIYKTDVYKVARWYNAARQERIIPENIFDKAPSAELRPGQTDQDSLPPYDVLDAILRKILDERADPSKLALPGVDQATINKVVRLIGMAEFKRHQSPPVVALSDAAFGEEWVLPIAARPWPVMPEPSE